MFYNIEDLKLIIKNNEIFTKEIIETDGLIIKELKNNNLISFDELLDFYREVLRNNRAEDYDFIIRKHIYIHFWGDFDLNELKTENKILLSIILCGDKNYYLNEDETQKRMVDYDINIQNLNKKMIDCLLNEKLLEKEEFFDIVELLSKNEPQALDNVLDTLNVYSYDLYSLIEEKTGFLKLINKQSLHLNKTIYFQEDDLSKLSSWFEAYEKILLDESVKEKKSILESPSDIQTTFFINNNITIENKEFLEKNKDQLFIFRFLGDRLVKLTHDLDSGEDDNKEIIQNLQNQLINMALKIDKNNLQKEIYQDGLSPNLMTYALSIRGIINQDSFEFLNNVKVNTPLLKYVSSRVINPSYASTNFRNWGECYPLRDEEIDIYFMRKENFIKDITKMNEFIIKFEGISNSARTRTLRFKLQNLVNTNYFKPNENKKNDSNLDDILKIISLKQFTFEEAIKLFEATSKSEIPEIRALVKYQDSLIQQYNEDKLVKSNELSLFAQDLAFSIFQLHTLKMFDDNSMPYEIALFKEGLTQIIDFYNDYKNNQKNGAKNIVLLLQEEILKVGITNILTKINNFADELHYIDEDNYKELMKNINVDKIISLYSIIEEMNEKNINDITQNNEVVLFANLENIKRGTGIDFIQMDVSKTNRMLKPITEKRIEKKSLEELLDLNFIYARDLIKNKEGIDFTKKDLDKYGLDLFAKYFDKLLSSDLIRFMKREDVLFLLVVLDEKYQISDVKLLDEQIDILSTHDLITYTYKLLSYAYEKEGKSIENLMKESLVKYEKAENEANKFTEELYAKSKESKEKMHPPEEVKKIFLESYYECKTNIASINANKLSESDILSFIKVEAIHNLLETNFYQDFYWQKGQELLDCNFIERKFIHAKEYSKVLSKIYEKYQNKLNDGIGDFLANKINDDIYESNGIYINNMLYGYNSLIQLNEEYSLVTKQDMLYGNKAKELAQKVSQNLINENNISIIKRINDERLAIAERLNTNVTIEDLFNLSLFESTLFNDIFKKSNNKKIVLKADSFLKFIDEILEKTNSVEILEQFLLANNVGFSDECKKQLVEKILSILPKDNKAVICILELFRNKELEDNTKGDADAINYVIANFKNDKNMKCFIEAILEIGDFNKNRFLSDESILEISNLVIEDSAFNLYQTLKYNKEIVEKLFAKKSEKNIGAFVLLKKAEKKFNQSILQEIYKQSTFGNQIEDFYKEMKKENVTDYFVTKLMGIVMDIVVQKEILPHLINNTGLGHNYMLEFNKDDSMIINEIFANCPNSLESFNNLKENFDKYFAKIISSGSGLFLINNIERAELFNKYGEIVDSSIRENPYGIANGMNKGLENRFKGYYVSQEERNSMFNTGVEYEFLSKQSYQIIHEVFKNQSDFVLSEYRFGMSNIHSDNLFKFLAGKDLSFFEQIIREKELKELLSKSNKEDFVIKSKKKI